MVKAFTMIEIVLPQKISCFM